MSDAPLTIDPAACKGCKKCLAACPFDALHMVGKLAARMIAEGGFTLRALYIGGGTPTALGEEDFAALLNAVGECFPNPVEYTVEAGRPDTITQGKLYAMREHGVTRASVNPQTMNDDTLVAIGRGHTAAETVERGRPSVSAARVKLEQSTTRTKMRKRSMRSTS